MASSSPFDVDSPFDDDGFFDDDASAFKTSSRFTHRFCSSLVFCLNAM